VAFPAVTEVTRVVSGQALVAYRGNFYSIGPGMSGATVHLRHRLGQPTIDIRTAGGVILAVHRLEPDGAGAICRHASHVRALERSVLTQFSNTARCRPKQRRPPSVAAVAEAARLRGQRPGAAEQVVIDFTAYVTAADAAGAPTAGAPSGEQVHP